ncbi:MAG: transglutaminase family protein, partial [Hyphomonadaceae bacterium]
ALPIYWAEGFVLGEQTDTLSLLKDINNGVSAWVSYQSRDDEGTQGPLDTIDRGWGSCRDLAVLLAETARVLGFGARIASGYLYDPTDTLIGSADGGATHAWTEIYLPGAGWIAFDPTNRTVGGGHLIRVAVARSIEQVSPIIGSFVGSPGDFLGMEVSVQVSRI